MPGHCFSLNCRKYFKQWPTVRVFQPSSDSHKRGYKFEVLGQSLVKIYENLRKVPWFLDWDLTSFFGLTLRKWADIWCKRSNISKAYAQHWSQLQWKDMATWPEQQSRNTIKSFLFSVTSHCSCGRKWPEWSRRKTVLLSSFFKKFENFPSYIKSVVERQQWKNKRNSAWRC